MRFSCKNFKKIFIFWKSWFSTDYSHFSKICHAGGAINNVYAVNWTWNAEKAQNPTNSMKGITLRCIGFKRAWTQIGLLNLVYNMCRYEILKKACAWYGIAAPIWRKWVIKALKYSVFWRCSFRFGANVTVFMLLSNSCGFQVVFRGALKWIYVYNSLS